VKEESELITGEAVVLELRVAKLASRGVAMLLDVLLQGVLLLIIFVVLGFTGYLTDNSLSLTLMLIAFVLVLVGYPVLFETLSRGRTLGKMALGLRVVRADGGPIRFRHALARGLCGVLVDFWLLGFLGSIAVIVSLVSRDGKRVGDYLAGTVVIRERVPDAGSASLITMPPPLAHWASQLDLTGLANDLALAIRQYLGRMGELRPEAAEALGYGLAEQVGRAIGAPPPPGVPIWAYLSAVLAERRSRDEARVLGAQAPMAAWPQASAPVPMAAWPQATYVHPVPPATAPRQPFAAEPPAPENPFTPPG
jgi:uncharacterized RDD family membrane protein YckC